MATTTLPSRCLPRISRTSVSPTWAHDRVRNSMRRLPASAANSAMPASTWAWPGRLRAHSRKATSVAGSGAVLRGRSLLRRTCLQGLASRSPRSTATFIRLDISRFARTDAVARSTRRYRAHTWGGMSAGAAIPKRLSSCFEDWV